MAATTAANPATASLPGDFPVDRNDENTFEDPLLPFLSTSGPLAHVREALLDKGFCVLRNVLTEDECNHALSSIWDFIEDTSSGSIDRNDAASWYPKSGDESSEPWPHTGYKSFSDMFQSLGSGWVLGATREALAERVFEPLYQTRELHSSKEGFTFHRPTAPTGDVTPPESWVQQVLNSKHVVCGEEQQVSQGEHYDQSHECRGLYTIQSLVAFEDQEEGVDGHFLCFPHSHGKIHQELTKDIYRGKFAWIPLTDEEIQRLLEEMCLEYERVYLKKGDMILWRSDLVHAALPPTGRTSRFRAVGYTSMQPASLTPASVYEEKMSAYKQRQTGDHSPHVESWHSHRQDNPNHRPAFRTSPPLVTRRLAELYGLLPYNATRQDLNRALIRGVRFAPESLPTQPSVRQCPARLEFISASATERMVGQDKYMGGMASPCGTYIYGVPGTAKRVLRINTKTNEMDWIGDSYEGKFKWLRGVEIPAAVMHSKDFPRGCCLALPSNATSILKINPETNEVTTFGNDIVEQASTTGWAYHGGNLASNGMLYAIPANADRVLKINPRTEECCFIGPSFPGKQSWFGGIIGSDGCIYGIPHNQVGVLKINPTTDEVSVLMQDNGEPLPDGQWKWHGGLAAGDKIFGYPNNADEVLVVNVKEQRVYTIGDSTVLHSGRHRIPQDGRYKYLGGALTLDEKYTYLFPCDAERVLKIHNETDTLELVGPLLLDGENKYQNGFVSEIDGCLYGIPQRATGILRIDPTDDHVDVMSCGESMVETKDKFEGGVMGLDGNMYCIPLRSKTCVKIIPAKK